MVRGRDVGDSVSESSPKNAPASSAGTCSSPQPPRVQTPPGQRPRRRPFILIAFGWFLFGGGAALVLAGILSLGVNLDGAAWCLLCGGVSFAVGMLLLDLADRRW